MVKGQRAYPSQNKRKLEESFDIQDGQVNMDNGERAPPETQFSAPIRRSQATQQSAVYKNKKIKKRRDRKDPIKPSKKGSQPKPKSHKKKVRKNHFLTTSMRYSNRLLKKVIKNSQITVGAASLLSLACAPESLSEDGYSYFIRVLCRCQAESSFQKIKDLYLAAVKDEKMRLSKRNKPEESNDAAIADLEWSVKSVKVFGDDVEEATCLRYRDDQLYRTDALAYALIDVAELRRELELSYNAELLQELDVQDETMDAESSS